MTIRDIISEAAESFVEELLLKIRSLPLEDIVGLTGAPVANTRTRAAKTDASPTKRTASPSGRLPRRSVEDLEAVVELIVKALKGAPDGLRSEQLQETLQISKKEIVGPVTLALKNKQIKKQGQKRATTYFLAGSVTKLPTKVKSTKKAAARTGKASPAKMPAKTAKVVKTKTPKRSSAKKPEGKRSAKSSGASARLAQAMSSKEGVKKIEAAKAATKK